MNRDVYISFTKKTQVTGDRIKLGDVAEIFCEDNNLLGNLKNLVLAHNNSPKDKVYVFTAVSIIKNIQGAFESVSVNCLGASEFAVISKRKKDAPVWWNWIKVLLVSLIVLAGGAFAIIAYGNDVDIKNVFAGISEYLSGEKSDGRIMGIAYSVGLSVGIIAFFNSFKDPTPMQVSMKNYEEDLYDTVVDRNVEEGKIGDVD